MAEWWRDLRAHGVVNAIHKQLKLNCLACIYLAEQYQFAAVTPVTARLSPDPSEHGSVGVPIHPITDIEPTLCTAHAVAVPRWDATLPCTLVGSYIDSLCPSGRELALATAKMQNSQLSAGGKRMAPRQ